jgi:hypothetical protein
MSMDDLWHPRVRDEAPFQLWAELRCPGLYDFHPISVAAHEAKYRAEQKRQGVVRLDQCRLVSEFPHAY